MDSTHGTNAYRFYLITVLVVDDFGEGLPWPVAWCLSNREHEQALTCFLDEKLLGRALFSPSGSCLTTQTSISMRGLIVSVLVHKSCCALGMLRGLGDAT